MKFVNAIIYAIVFDIVSTIDNQQANVIFRDFSLGEVFVDIESGLNFLKPVRPICTSFYYNHNCFDEFKVVLLFHVGGSLMISTCVGLCYFLDSLTRD